MTGRRNHHGHGHAPLGIPYTRSPNGTQKVYFTSRQPSEPCPVCKVIIRKHPRCPECDILVGYGHYQSRACSGDIDLHPEGMYWMLAKMVLNLKADLASKREHKRALAYVQSDDWAQWMGLIGVSASDAREALIETQKERVQCITTKCSSASWTGVSRSHGHPGMITNLARTARNPRLVPG